MSYRKLDGCRDAGEGGVVGQLGGCICRGRAIGPSLAGHRLDRTLVQILPDGVVVHGGSERHKDVPDGVGERDDAVTLEEEDAEAVDEAAARQLLKAVGVAHRRDDQSWKEAHG